MKIKFIKPFRFIGNNPDDGSDDTIPVGHVVDLENDESTQWLIDNGFAKEVIESGWWKPQNGENYYCINLAGGIEYTKYEGSYLDEFAVLVGNCFKTYFAADRCRDYLKADTTVRQDEGVLTPEQAATTSYIYYIRADGESQLAVHGFNADYVSVNTVLFDTREHAQASLDRHPAEWKIIANYDWSRE